MHILAELSRFSTYSILKISISSHIHSVNNVLTDFTSFWHVHWLILALSFEAPIVETRQKFEVPAENQIWFMQNSLLEHQTRSQKLAEELSELSDKVDRKHRSFLNYYKEAERALSHKN